MINFQTSFGFVKKVFVDPVILLRFAMVFLDLILKLISPKHSDLKFICRILFQLLLEKNILGVSQVGFRIPQMHSGISCSADEFPPNCCCRLPYSSNRLPMTNSPRTAVVGFRIPQMHSGISSSRSRIPRAAVVAFLQSQHHFQDNSSFLRSFPLGGTVWDEMTP